MILIGMMHDRKKPEQVKKAYAYAASAKAEGAELLYFTPGNINVKKETITGYIYENGSWVEKECRIPDVIYNSGSPEKFKKHQPEIAFLKTMAPFTTVSVGNKLSVYRRLLKDGEFALHLIPSITLSSSRDLFAYLLKHPKTVFKPAGGHKGQGILFIEKTEDAYRIRMNDTHKTLNQTALAQLIDELLAKTEYLVQPYIESVTKSGASCDFRLHTQKDGEGSWTITAIYPRIAPQGSIVTNINSGGYTNYLAPFLKQEYGSDYQRIKNRLEDFALRLSIKMDELQMRLYQETIDELGIDVGMDQTGKIWLYEVNWRPGCPPAFYLELDVVKKTIRYAMRLAKKGVS